jgi:membrane-bound lytic murein transglycosylase A
MRPSGIIAILAASLLLLAGYLALTPIEQKTAQDGLFLKETSFERLPGWDADHQEEAIAPLQKSCARINRKDPADDFGAGGFAGSAEQWQDVCRKLSVYLLPAKGEARKFFQDNFTPYEVWGEKGREGLFTGYYEPTLHGSRKKHGAYKIPLYSRPNDLIEVDLGDFKSALKGETIRGRVQGQKLTPYYSRAEIEKGRLKGRRHEIVWVNNAVDAFFLHIQGSGRIIVDGKKVLRVGYAAENGHPYTAIGRELIRRGVLTKENVSMPAIRDWLEKHPAEAAGVMELNASYIFFRKAKDDGGPLGAEGIPLTPRRSMAVDRKKIPYGVPLWLDAGDPDGKDRLQRLMIAQDTGGAITGAVRGDFFWGAGLEAAHKAGLMKSRGHSWLLLPKSIAVPEEKIRKPWWMRLPW